MIKLLSFVKKHFDELARAIALANFMVFTILSVVLALKGMTWTGYGDYALATVGGGSFGPLLGHFINSKYNSPPGMTLGGGDAGNNSNP